MDWLCHLAMPASARKRVRQLPFYFGPAKLQTKKLNEHPNAAYLAQFVHHMIASEPLADVKSVDIRDAETLDAISGAITRPAVILLAVEFDRVLLIDQYVITPK